MNSRPFRLLVVADDRKILRRLSRFLKVFGFLVDPVADGRQARAVYEAHPPDFLIVDGDSPAMQHCRSLFSENRNGYTYSFLLVRDMHMEGLTEALRAGVDDFLAKPLVYGELLARLRSGARVLEYERRMREQSAIDLTTSLLSRSAFQDRLQSELDGDGKKILSCVLLDLDFFDNINRLYGFGSGDEVLRAIADHLKSMAGECKYLASFGSGRFAAMLPDTSDARALAWAESVREAISRLEVPVAHETIALTGSLGVSSSLNDGTAAKAVIELAEEAVVGAKASGRNCVARCGQFDGETREWEDLATQGRLFDNTVARDVMISCPLVACGDDDLQRVAELLDQTRLSDIPVVDAHGKVVGLFNRDRLPGQMSRSSTWRKKVKDVMDRDAPMVGEDTSFNDLMDFFTSGDDAQYVAIVVRHDQPLGMVFRNGLAALSEPLTTDRFAPEIPCSLSSDYLLVPDA